MIDPSATRGPARPIGLVGVAVVALAFVVACSSATTAPSVAAPATSSPVAVASQSPAASPSVDVASPSADAASPSPSKAPGRYYAGDPTPTPKPTAGSTPKPTPKPTPGPTSKPASIVVKSRSTSLGTVLVGPNGMTLYTRKSDPANGSTCSGGCADSWPPFLVKTGTVVSGGSGVAGRFATFSRSGKRQVTYKGRALYYFVGDAYVGDTNGQGLGGVWYVAKP
jgi:predicted lipoprotein with Yx(FWY)xxD motif